MPEGTGTVSWAEPGRRGKHAVLVSKHPGVTCPGHSPLLTCRYMTASEVVSQVTHRLKAKQAANPQTALFTNVKSRGDLRLLVWFCGESGLLETFRWDFADLWEHLGQHRE